jgi:hypothetical protein
MYHFFPKGKKITQNKEKCSKASIWDNHSDSSLESVCFPLSLQEEFGG